jgi:hypothetical protein
MRRRHHTAIGVADGDGSNRSALVDDRSGDGGEMGGATGVGDSKVWLG